MKFPYKIYVGKEMIAATNNPDDAARLIYWHHPAVIKADGRVVWNTAKDGGTSGDIFVVTIRTAKTMLDRRRHNYEDSRRRFDEACAKSEARRQAEGRAS